MNTFLNLYLNLIMAWEEVSDREVKIPYVMKRLNKALLAGDGC